MSNRYIRKYFLTHIFPVIAGTILYFVPVESAMAQDPPADSTEVAYAPQGQDDDRRDRRDRRDRGERRERSEKREENE